MTITARYAAVCPCCRAAITPGQSIEWTKGTPAQHTSCARGVAAGASSPLPRTTAAPSRTSRRPGKWTGCSCGSREDSYGDLIPARNNCASCEHDA